MSKSKIVPCLWFDDQAEQAAAAYTKLFPAGRITAVSHYPESRDNPGQKPRGSVLTVDFEIAGARFTALNGGPVFAVNPTISFFVQLETPGEAEERYLALAEGGQVLMPFGAYPWSPGYGWIQDRFGVSWQVMSGPRPKGAPTIVPCLMFAGGQNGKAEEAMERYTGIFPASRIEHLERYTAGEGPEGAIKHGRFLLAGQEMVAMDSHLAHDLMFNEGLSLQVMCDDQGEVDRYWTLLSDGGSEGPCGWLKDRYGLSWQVVPSRVSEWMSDENPAGRDRAFDALLKMNKLDISALQAAYDGTSQVTEAHP